MWPLFLLIIIVVVFTYNWWVKKVKLRNEAQVFSLTHEHHEKAENEHKAEEKPENAFTGIQHSRSYNPQNEMKDDNEKKVPGGPNEPGAAGGDTGGPMQRDINETETPVSVAFSVKGYTLESIDKAMVNTENRVTYDNKDIYIGEVWDGWRQGVGKYNYDNDGSMFFGEWILGSRHGLGLFIWQDGERYEGEWVYGKMHGNGKYFYNNGDFFDGDWVNDLKQGQGDYSYKGSGSRYKGAWLADKRNGKGTFWWANGDYYEGDWAESKMNGFGIYVFATGDHFEGNWMEDKRCGYGVYTYDNGDRFEGNWLDGNRTGYGVYYYENGDIFDGNFRDNEFHGFGKFAYIDGRVEEGLWDTGELVKPV
jgi:hypothetical protein